MESWFIARSHLGPSIQSGSSPSAALQVFTQSTHLSKECYPQLVLNPLCYEIWPPKQLDYKSMLLHPVVLHIFKTASERKIIFFLFLDCSVNYERMTAKLWRHLVLAIAVAKAKHFEFGLTG